MKHFIINHDKLQKHFPTHQHSPLFGEHLGRTIATYGFLEEVLGKAIFAFTATREYADDKIDEAYKAWLPKLERALSDPLGGLADSYRKAVRDNPESTIKNKNIDDLVEDIKRAAVIRNVLCHGSWQSPNIDGASVPLFVNRQREVFDTAIDISFLEQVQSHVAELACCVIDSVTHVGWQFPGSNGPGKSIIGDA